MKIVEQTALSRVPENAPPRRVSIVDDDASIREALKSLMRSVRFDVEAFASAEDFLASKHLNNSACLILDVSLPGMSGFELQTRLKQERPGLPIVFITAHADEASRERALKSGAIDLLAKPVRRDTLFKAIQAAFERL